MTPVNKRRSFLKSLAMGGAGVVVAPMSGFASDASASPDLDIDLGFDSGSAAAGVAPSRAYNGPYTGENLKKLAFPIGGMGAGMFCFEGTGAISTMSVRNRPDMYNEPAMFAAIAIKGLKNGVKVLEGQVPDWKRFGYRGTGTGATGSTYGLPRFEQAAFTARFPFGNLVLQDTEIPLKVSVKGWSPFIPTDEDNSGLPVGAIEYTFTNKGASSVEAVFSYSSKNFMGGEEGAVNKIESTQHGFVLCQEALKAKPHAAGAFAIFTDDTATVVDHCWFRGGWWDPLTMAWNNVRDMKVQAVAPVEKDAPGASLYVPFTLRPGATKTIRLMMAWYVPDSDLRIGDVVVKEDCIPESGCCSAPADLGVANGKTTDAPNYKPWYSSRFSDVEAVAAYWRAHYQELFKNTKLFSDTFYSSTLPPEVLEAVAANLTILKSPTVLRQYDGRMWNWEGTGDDGGSCHGSCTHVWNYAQAVPHLFPAMERTLRNTEFCENQNKEGHQGFRANIPISPLKHDFHAASDGQLGGIMKVYREWRISGDNAWLKRIYPAVAVSMDYCIRTWDPREKGIVEEPHHNTYDIEFWGPDGMITSFYLGALTAITVMGKHLGKDVSRYEGLYAKGKVMLETQLFDGEYFVQEIEYKGLKAENPAKAQSFGGDYSPEAVKMLMTEGPKYQYGKGCLSDGILGAWIGSMCGLEDFVDRKKVLSHLLAIHKYNLRTNLKDHANPQRPSFALGNEGGLLLCTWPKGGKLSLPFVYSDEVWTGIEYQVASHLMEMGEVEKGLSIVRLCRNRYDGKVRNAFNEYECGHWYARALSSYGLLQGMTGVRYDAVDKTLYVDSRVGDFTSFLSTASGFGTVSLRGGKASLKTVFGRIDVARTVVSGKEA